MCGVVGKIFYDMYDDFIERFHSKYEIVKIEMHTRGIFEDRRYI